MPTFDFTVDNEPFSTQEHTLTPTQILQMAGRDPNTYYLVEIEGEHKKSYKDDPNASIHMHEHQKFISIYNGQTNVS